MKRILIKDVLPDSIAEEMEIEPGDFLLSVNDTEIKDILDYKYQIFDEFIVVTVEKANGEIWDLEIDKEENEDLGIVFEEQLIDKARSCANKCIFCFMDQLTPINVSVHATDGEVRKMMLNNKNADKILDYIQYLTERGIQINAQIVLCPDINDGKILDKTIEDLSHFSPNLLSIAIVPVGLTKYRQNLYQLKTFDKESAGKLIDQVEKWQKIFKKKLKTNLVFCADEFYVKAQREIPEYTRYENFDQLEDGIGLLAYFTMYFNKSLMRFKPKKMNKVVSIACGKSAYAFIREKANILESVFDGLKIHVYAIENTFFGPEITVTGLIVGGDLIEQLRDKELGDYLVIDKKMLKEDADIFLDDTTLEEVKKGLNDIKIVKSGSLGEGFINAVINGKSIND